MPVRENDTAGRGAPGALFTIRQVCQATGFSRAMLIKLEQQGILKPRRIDPENGYRYYDMFNVMDLNQYQTLRELGISRESIQAFFSADTPQVEGILEELRVKQALAQRGIEEFSAWPSGGNDQSFAYVRLAGQTCFCRERLVRTPAETLAVARAAYEEAIRRGYRVKATEKLFSMRDYDPDAATDGPYRTKVCIPVDAQGLSPDEAAAIEEIPGCRALSLVCYGRYDAPGDLQEGVQRLWDEFRRRGHAAGGKMRGLSIVIPDYRLWSELDNYVLRFAIPIRE